MRGLFITGTDTDVGKTYVTALISHELRNKGVRVGVCKPACSGADMRDGQPVWNDIERLAEAAGIDDRGLICSQRFRAPLAPPVAASQEDRAVDETVCRQTVSRWKERCELLLIEGVGGLLCPLTESSSIADFAQWTGFPLIIVARLGLGTINHTLLTLEYAAQQGLPVAGVILSDGDQLAQTPAGRTNADQLEARIDVPLLGIVPFGADSIRLRDGISPARIAWNQLADG
ncbi:MAG: dethiobiotin synthase [Planctomycetota bacterium]|jgi:dethiobiotin synthetase